MLRTPCLIALHVATLCILFSPALNAVPFLRGDVNGSGKLEVSDSIATLGFHFLRDPPSLSCLDAADANDDGRLGLSDPLHTLVFLFAGGRPPAAPSGRCGDDPTPDELSCIAHEACSRECDREAQAIAEESGIVGSCSAVVRLSYRAKEILGWQLICGRYSGVVKPDDCECSECFNPGPPMPPEREGVVLDAWATADIGRIGLASARTGLTVFCGAVVFDPDGGGEIIYPREWRSSASLAASCEPIAQDLSLQTYDWDGGPLADPAGAEEALSVVWRTALPEGLSRSGYLFDAAVLRYSPRVFFADDRGFDASSAEWIVVINAGWLE